MKPRGDRGIALSLPFPAWVLLAGLASTFSLNPQIAHATEIAVTVDDLPVHDEIPTDTTRLEVAQRVIAALTSHHAPEVYGFVNAIGLQNEPDTIEVLKTWLVAGYSLGNHTFSHPDLAKTPLDKYIADIDRNEPILTELTQNGGPDFHFFRYPFLSEGETQKKRDGVRSHLFGKGYQVAQVTMDFQDYSWTEAYLRCKARGDEAGVTGLKKSFMDLAMDRMDLATQLATRIQGHDIKHVLLLHLSAFEAVMMDELLSAYAARGVKFISLRDALQDDVYQLNPNRLSKDGGTLLDQLADLKGVDYPAFKEIPVQALSKACR